MTTDYRDLITRMAKELDNYRQLLLDDRTVTHRLSDEARAALAEPEPKGPTRQELKTFACEWWRTFGYVKDKTTCGWIIDDIDPEHFVDFMDDTLARWGNPVPAPPSDGEVARLVAWLRRIGPCNDEEAANLNRAAELLQRQALVPVSVSERPPGPGDMTEDGEVWIEDSGLDYPLADTGDYDWEPHKWILRPISKSDAKSGLRWLPAYALPLPEVGE